jgi:HEAT repeat protein
VTDPSAHDESDPSGYPDEDPAPSGNRHIHLDPPPTPEVAERRRHAVLAGHTGDVDTARSLRLDPAPVVRAAALGALARAGGLTDDELAGGLTDTDAAVRRRALEILGAPEESAGDPAGAPSRSLVELLAGLLAGLLSDHDPTVVEVACWAAGEHPGSADVLVEPLVAVAGTGLGPEAERPGHPDHLCREAAVSALGALGHEAGRASVLAGLTQKATIRRRAVLALAAFEGDDVEAALTEALDDRDWQVRQAAEDLLGVDPAPG